MRNIIESLLIGFLLTWTPVFTDLNALQRITGTFGIGSIVLAIFLYLEDKKEPRAATRKAQLGK